MESIPRSLDMQQAFQTEPNFDKYARQILENSKTAATVVTPTKITDFLQEFGATFINSIQLQNFQKTLNTNRSSNAPSSNLFTFNSTSMSAATNSSEMEIEFIPNHIIIDSSSFETMDELQKQLEYDKFMNEIWIGIVLTLILISMIFCVCSCFLYHQFRTWKRNYHSTVVQVHSADIESLKLESSFLDDPVPEYTLVSGLPSYEAALELLHKTPTKSCLIVYPSVFNVFNKNERSTTGQLTVVTNATSSNLQQQQPQQQQQQQQQNNIDITTPLLSNTTTIYPKANETNTDTSDSNTTIILPNNNELTIDATVNEKELLELFNETNTATKNLTKPLEEIIIVKNDKGI